MEKNPLLPLNFSHSFFFHENVTFSGKRIYFTFPVNSAAHWESKPLFQYFKLNENTKTDNQFFTYILPPKLLTLAKFSSIHSWS